MNFQSFIEEKKWKFSLNPRRVREGTAPSSALLNFQEIFLLNFGSNDDIEEKATSIELIKLQKLWTFYGHSNVSNSGKKNVMRGKRKSKIAWNRKMWIEMWINIKPFKQKEEKRHKAMIKKILSFIYETAEDSAWKPKTWCELNDVPLSDRIREVRQLNLKR